MKLNMKLCQKLEFWILAVPALMVSLGAIAHYGVWRVLWVFPVGYTLSSFSQLSTGMVREVLDGPRTNACRKGKWPRAFGLAMLIPLYNWFVAAALVDCLNLLMVWRYHGAMPLPFVYCIVFAVGFAVATVVRAIRGASDGGYGELLIETERAMLLAAIPVSAFVNLTSGLFALATVALGVVIVGVQGALWYEKERKRFLEFWEAEKKGVPFEMRGQRKWFPRPGVIFEPSVPMVLPNGTKISSSDSFAVRQAMTVLRVSPVVFLSLALLLGGAAVLIDRGSWTVAIAAFGALVLWFLHSAFAPSKKLDKWVGFVATAAPCAICYLFLAALVVGFGTDNLVLLIATGAFIVGCFEFPTRHLVRATSDRDTDALRFFATVAAMGIAIWVRVMEDASWCACGLCATVTAYPLALARCFWPVKILERDEGSGMRDEVRGMGNEKESAAAKERRDRKRQRQMEAFRRSQRG